MIASHHAISAAAVVLVLAGRLHADEARPWIGVSSCSAQPCHGDVARDNVWPIWGNEVTVWLERDPHAQAYRVLSNELSKRMAQRLRLGVPANRSELCLSCHSPGDAIESQPLEPALADGVGCESCHGSAKQWLAQHTLAGWRNKTVQDKRQLGMVDTQDIHGRAKACAACHVGTAVRDGSPGGEVNHDLIAAGHPALKFEFTAYLAKMPKHWSEKSPGAGFDARAWVVGQAASASAALRLLASRADGSRQRPWPEFAEYDCYSCHHQLYGPTKARSHELIGQRPGLPVWGTWYLPLASVLSEDAARSNAVKEVDRLMQRPGDDRKKLTQAAEQAVRLFDRLGEKLATENYSAAAVESLLVRLNEAAPRVTASNWDGEAQLYLALVAMHYAKHDSDGPPPNDPLTRSLRQTREELMFPSLTEGGGSRRFDSPRGLDAQATLRERLLPEIERLLKE
jgi:hypothetical protein